MSDTNLYGGIEAGGTKFICALASEPPVLTHNVTFDTTSPGETLQRVSDFFLPFQPEVVECLFTDLSSD